MCAVAGACRGASLKQAKPHTHSILEGPPLGNLTVDGLFTGERSSISFISELMFDVAPLRAKSACLRINATVVTSQPPRAENKVKLFSFVLL